MNFNNAPPTRRQQPDNKFVNYEQAGFFENGSMKILLIEDEVKLAEYLRKGLGEAGYVVDVAQNGVACTICWSWTRCSQGSTASAF